MKHSEAVVRCFIRQTSITAVSGLPTALERTQQAPAALLAVTVLVGILHHISNRSIAEPMPNRAFMADEFADRTPRTVEYAVPYVPRWLGDETCMVIDIVFVTKQVRIAERCAGVMWLVLPAHRGTLILCGCHRRSLRFVNDELLTQVFVIAPCVRRKVANK